MAPLLGSIREHLRLFEVEGVVLDREERVAYCRNIANELARARRERRLHKKMTPPGQTQSIRVRALSPEHAIQTAALLVAYPNENPSLIPLAVRELGVSDDGITV